MGEPSSIRGHFSDKGAQGFTRAQNAPLAAAQNPEFLNNYRKLLSTNDRVISIEMHLDESGIRFMGSKENMRLLEQQNYKVILLERSPQINPMIEKFETGQASISDVSLAWQEILYERAALQDPRLTAVPREKINPHLADMAEPLMIAIQNAKDHGIRIRAIDTRSDENTTDIHNAHLAKPRHRDDSAWHGHIETFAKGQKTALLIGPIHVATSAGIDEYMERDGYRVGTFRIQNKLDLPDPTETNYEGNICHNIQIALREERNLPQGNFDRSDFAPDLFYHEADRTLAVKSQMEASCMPTSLQPAGTRIGVQ